MEQNGINYIRYTKYLFFALYRSTLPSKPPEQIAGSHSQRRYKLRAKVLTNKKPRIQTLAPWNDAQLKLKEHQKNQIFH